MNRLYAVIIVFVTLISFHCQKEVGHIDPPVTPGTDLSKPDPVTATVQGNVLDENGQPAAGVAIKAGNKNVITDQKGYFRIINAPLDRNASLVTAEKTGYFKAYRSFSATEAANHVTIKLIKKQLAGTINASGGEATLSNGAKVALPANAVVKAAGGSYSGDIKVYAAYIDPTATDIGATVPGSFMADNSSNERVTLASYGMLAVELESSAGEKLQIATGQQATLTVPIPASIRSSAPAEISLWYVNEQTGIWKEEGKATRSGNNYTGSVKHFSFWNCDIGLPTVMLTLQLKNGEGLPLVHTNVKIKGMTGGVPSFGYGTTDSVGRIRGLVLSGQALTLEVFSNDCTGSIYTTTIGPFSDDTDLGTITIANNNSLITIKGKLLNCNGTPVTAGVALINIGTRNFYASANLNGEFSLAYVKCVNSPSNFTVIGIDKDEQQESEPATFALTAPETNTGTINACGTSSAQFITYKIDGTEYGFNNGNALDSVIAFSYLVETPSPHYVTYISANNYAQNKSIYVSFNSPAQATGTYPIEALSANQYNAANIISPSTVTVTKFPQSGGSFYEGSFSGQFRDSLNQDPVHTISGSFRIRRK